MTHIPTLEGSADGGQLLRMALSLVTGRPGTMSV